MNHPCLATVIFLFWGAPGVQEKKEGRYEQFTRKVAEGPKMKVVAATCFGGPGIEEFIAARPLPDGSVAAFGNAGGPEFPGTPKILGKGQHRGLKAASVDNKGRATLRPENPDIAGMVVFYAAGLSAIARAIRFDWGVASLSAGEVTKDGKSLIIAGRCTAAFREAATGARIVPEPLAPEAPAGKKPPPRETGPYDYEGVSCPGDVFVLRLSLEGAVEWAWVFEGHRTPPEQVWALTDGSVYADVRGLHRISPDGKDVKKLCPLALFRTAKYLAVDPADGSFYYGGDRNTNTGKEPWRQPYLYKFDKDGGKVWKLWEWPPKSLRDGMADGYDGLVSDSSPRAGDLTPAGELLIGGWSDGGNSVFSFQPTDCTKPVPKAPMEMSCWGMKGANSIAHVMKIDLKTQQVLAHAHWVAYIPMNFTDERMRGAPNGARIRQIKAHPDGAVAICGGAASVLVQTPNALAPYAGDGRGAGGDCVVVYDKEMANLLFSSYLPGCENAAIWSTPRGFIVTSRSRGDDGGKPPAVNALQPEKRGEADAHIILLEFP
jgi:hypothetical protein